MEVIDRIVEVLRLLVIQSDGTWDDDAYGWTICLYCNESYKTSSGRFTHLSTCPIILGRELLKELERSH